MEGLKGDADRTAAPPAPAAGIAAPGNAETASQPLLADVARLAGVSTATVSRFLNEPSKVTERTRAKVQAAIDRLDWVPNAAARSLVSRRSYAVGAIVPTLEHEKFHQQLQAFQSRLGAEGLALFVACSSYEPAEGYRHARGMIARGVDAIALVGDDYPDALFELLAAKGIPYVVTFGKRAGSPHPCVGYEHSGAFALITRRLLALGHQRFGVIFESQKGNSRLQARLGAIHDTLAEHGLAVRPPHFALLADNGGTRVQFARQAFRQLMQAEPAPTAIICGNDTMAIGALLEAKTMGLDVPGVVSITGCDDIELAEQVHPPLTTVRVPDREMGALAAEYLIARIAGKSPDNPAMMEASLIERESTGPAPANS